MTPEDLAAIRARDAAETNGPPVKGAPVWEEYSTGYTSSPLRTGRGRRGESRVGPPSSIPTVAEVREALAIAGLGFGVQGKQHTAAAMNDLLARLDPDRQVIVDRALLVWALDVALVSAGSTGAEQDADAILAVLRSAK